MRYIMTFCLFIIGCSSTFPDSEKYQQAYLLCQTAMPIANPPTLEIVPVDCADDHTVPGGTFHLPGACFESVKYNNRIAMSDSRYDDPTITAGKPSESVLSSVLADYIMWRKRNYQALSSETVTQQDIIASEQKQLQNNCQDVLLENGL